MLGQYLWKTDPTNGKWGVFQEVIAKPVQEHRTKERILYFPIFLHVDLICWKGKAEVLIDPGGSLPTQVFLWKKWKVLSPEYEWLQSVFEVKALKYIVFVIIIWSREIIAPLYSALTHETTSAHSWNHFCNERGVLLPLSHVWERCQ